MSAWVWAVIVVGALIWLCLGVAVVCIIVKDKRGEDARQRQRERQAEEMWARIDARFQTDNARIVKQMRDGV